MNLRMVSFLMLFGSLLPGCDQLIVGDKNRELIPETSEAALSFGFQAGETRLSRSEAREIDRFLSRLGLTNEDLLIVTVPHPGISAGNDARKDEMHRLLARYPARLRLVDGDPPLRSGQGNVQKGVIRIARVNSIAPSCEAEHQSAGCANLHNLAQMIAVPADGLLPSKGTRYRAPAQEAPVLPNLAGVTE